MDSLLRDVRHGLRLFRQAGGAFVVTAVLTLAVGIGANTAIFSLVNTVLLKAPPFPDVDRIVVFQTKGKEGAFDSTSPAKFAHYVRQTETVEDVAAFGGGVVNWTGGQLPRQLRCEHVSSNYFRLFGAAIVSGRSFTAQEDRPGASPVVVISEALWRGQFGGARDVVGRTMDLEGSPHVVTGVVSDRFDFRDFGPAPEVFLPFQLDPASQNQGHFFLSAGRLKPGVSLTEAKARLKASAFAYRRQFPDALDKDQSFTAVTVKESLIEDAQKSIWVMAAAVGFVLLIACANVANLLLARAEVRKRELAIRAALGAGRWRIVRQLLTESLLLSAAGAIVGLGVGIVSIRALLSVNTAGLPRVGLDGEMVSLDWRVLLFTVTITLATSLIFGLFPAWHAARTDLAATMKEGANRSGSGFRQNKARTFLVVTEVALSVMLLVGAGLLIRTAAALYGVQPGFRTDHILTLRMSLSGLHSITSQSIEVIRRSAVDQLEALPGVEQASAACCIPLEGGYGLPFKVMGRPLKDAPFHGGGGWKTVSPGYFEVFGMHVLRGRAFTERDGASGPPVVVINDSMAKKYWPKGDPLQDRILIGKGVMPELEQEPVRQVIGIVADQRDGALNRDPEPEMYVPNGQVTDALQALNVQLTPLVWVIRTRGEPMSVRSAVEEQLRRVTGLPVTDVRTMDQVVSRSTSRERFHVLLMSTFGGIALLLAAIGIYGLMSYSVAQRTQEIGIRMALGAERQHVRGMVLRQGLLFACIGVVVGLAGAFAVAKQIASFLFGVKQWDPVVFVVIPLVILVTALISVWWPAVRATQVDPANALRQS